jgi:hypothetical protein
MTHVILLDDSKRWARLSERSSSRGLIIGGVAAVVGVAAGASAFFIARANMDPDSDPQHGHAYELLAITTLSAGAAAGLTFMFTVPATRGLGTEVE